MPLSGVDGLYDRRKWSDEPQSWSYAGPFSDHEQEYIHQALTAQFMTHEEIADNVRAPLRQVAVFRPKLGYPTYQERQATIEDVINTPGRINAQGNIDYSGGPAGYTGSPRFNTNTVGQV